MVDGCGRVEVGREKTFRVREAIRRVDAVHVVAAGAVPTSVSISESMTPISGDHQDVTDRNDMTSLPSMISVCFDLGLAYCPPMRAIRTTGSFMPQIRIRLIESKRDKRCSIFSLVQ